MASCRGLVVLLLALLPICHAKLFSFTPYGQSQPTILLKADFTVYIRAFLGIDEVGTSKQGSEESSEIKLFGVQGPKSFLQLRFPNGLNWALVFNKASEADVYLHRTVQFIPSIIFPKLDMVSDLMTHGDPGNTDLHSTKNSWACDKEMTTEYYPTRAVPGKFTFRVFVAVAHFQVQAYNIKGSRFSPPMHCKSDWTTAGPSTTTTASTTTRNTTTTTTPPTTTTRPVIKPGTPVNIYHVFTQVGNDTFYCISMEGRLSFEMVYDEYLNPYATMRKKLKIPVPDNAITGGLCEYGEGTQQLSIRFYNDWYLDILFRMNTAYSRPGAQGDNQSKMDYSIEKIRLQYTMNRYIFPNAYDSGPYTYTLNLTKADELPRKRASHGYFSCDTAKEFKMNEDVSMVISDFKFKAFIENEDIYFYGRPNKCESDSLHASHPLMVVVGCFVVTFFLLIFIAIVSTIAFKCAQRRRRNRRRYRPI